MLDDRLGVFGQVGLRHIFKNVVFQAKKSTHEAGMFGERIVFTVGTSLSSHEDKSNKIREEATTL